VERSVLSRRNWSHCLPILITARAIIRKSPRMQYRTLGAYPALPAAFLATCFRTSATWSLEMAPAFGAKAVRA